MKLTLTYSFIIIVIITCIVCFLYPKYWKFETLGLHGISQTGILSSGNAKFYVVRFLNKNLIIIYDEAEEPLSEKNLCMGGGLLQSSGLGARSGDSGRIRHKYSSFRPSEFTITAFQKLVVFHIYGNHFFGNSFVYCNGTKYNIQQQSETVLLVSKDGSVKELISFRDHYGIDSSELFSNIYNFQLKYNANFTVGVQPISSVPKTPDSGAISGEKLEPNDIDINVSSDNSARKD